MLSPQWLDELRSRITLSSVISRSTRLIKAGREFKACCPFHNENTPSFTVNDEKGFYHCFGCGAHGDVIRWMTDQRGLSFMDAIRELAKEAGMELPSPGPQAAAQAQRRATLHEVMQAAQDWFIDNLRGPEGREAREYLKARGIDARLMERFGFGFAPDDRQALGRALSRFSEEMLIAAGLRIAVDHRDPYDRFRGRLMLPIADARGRVIAFGGRMLGPANSDAPKYLNSPDTPLFDKGRTLYNLHRAAPAARQSGRLIVVEGYMDVIALASAGIEECVAPLGTALTEQQIEILWRHVESPVLCFDGDAAGQRAAMRAVSRALPLLRPAHSLRIARLPAGLDPDDLVRREGREAMERLLGGASSLIETLWAHERDAVALRTPEDKAGLKARLVAHVNMIRDPDIRSLYRRELLERFSAFAFPKREPFGRGQGYSGVAGASHPETVVRLQRASSGGARYALIDEVIQGLMLWPQAILKEAEAIASLAKEDARFEALLDAMEENPALETDDLRAILAGRQLPLPSSDQKVSKRFPFNNPKERAEIAIETLHRAIERLVEQRNIRIAAAAALKRYEAELTDEARIEHERLLRRMMEIEGRSW